MESCFEGKTDVYKRQVNTVLDDKTIYKMQDRIKEKGYPVITMLSLIHILSCSFLCLSPSRERQTKVLSLPPIMGERR